ncbi:DUF2804 domain-containing protein [uncultured Aeromicrobium sp.]|uniref:DUF2804 domain-containing protein n=1 Tax=uncultured Aeromicrobium sp. TaxID=337820 RepID=UPI0025DDD021|nr:DUF2804 domain-containing protein [uncultured Aeromicrobium sp.]
MAADSSAREITTVVDLNRGSRLLPAAVGWTRRPLHRTPLPSRGRTKRWEYWGVMTEQLAIGLTIADLDYAHLEQVYVARLDDGREWVADSIGPGPNRPPLPDDLPPFTTSSKRLSFAEEPGGRTRLTVGTDRVRAELVVDPGGESLGVVVPWSPKRFQYTLKDLARRVRGHLTVDQTTHDIDGWTVLDRGRGIWPYRMTWNWGAGSGVVDGTTIGLQVGGQWTDGTGVTENALFVDGVAHYIGDDLHWTYDLGDPHAPWRVSGPRLDVTLTPRHRRVARTNALVIASRTHQAFGQWSGWVEDSSGTRRRVDGLLGWAEEARNRW